MKRKIKVTSKILCFALVFIMTLQISPITVGVVGETLSELTAELAGDLVASGTGSSGNLLAGGSDDVNVSQDNDAWDVPLATENPNRVNMNIPNGLVYTDYVYEKISSWGYTGNYRREYVDSTRRFEDLTASAGPMVEMKGYYDGYSGTWVNNSYLTTAVKRHDGSYGIHKNILTPTLTLGGYNNYYLVTSKARDTSDMIYIARANINHAFMRVGATSHPTGTVSFMYSELPVATYSPTGTTIKADLNLSNYLKDYSEFPGLKIGVPNDDGALISGIHVVFIDNTSPSIQNVSISQSGDQLVVKLTTNEGVRWAADAARDDLDDVWIEVDLKVVGTEKTQTIRAHVSEINYQYSLGNPAQGDHNFTNEIIFKGDLGVFADLDYKILDISNANMPQKDYPITFGTIVMYANQKRDHNIRNMTLSKWDNQKQTTVYETYNTTTICDTAGNPINLETVVNWPINQTEVKNDSTFVRKIELMNDKILLGGDMKNADAFLDSVSRADYFFGPNDEIAPRLSLNKILTEEEAASFKVKTNIKDASGEYIWLAAKSNGRYQIGDEEFMYIDFESIVLNSSMTSDKQDGNKSYFEIIDMSCDITSSPPLLQVIPAAEKTLYLDMTPPTATAKSNSLSEPLEENGYFKLDIEVNIEDTRVDGALQSGMLEQLAYFSLGAGVNEATPFRYLVTTESKQPDTVEEYTGLGKLVPDGKAKLEGEAMGMTSDAGNKVFIHLLIPKKTNLLINNVTVYTSVTDVVGNRTDENVGQEIEYHIDRQIPEISVSNIDTDYTSDSAIVTVRVNATDYNHVQKIRYQWVESGKAYDNSSWKDAVIDEGKNVSAIITEQFGGTKSTTYDMTLYLKCMDDRENESLVIQKEIKVNIDKPSTSYVVEGDLSSPSTHPSITVNGPDRSSDEKIGYTRVTVSPLNPKGDWAYVTVVKNGEKLDVFGFEGQWYKVKTSGAMFTEVVPVGENQATFDDVKNYYGNLKISFENAYADLVPMVGYKEDNVNDGSYIADQNFLTARFASQSESISGVNSVDFGKVTDISGNTISKNGDMGESALPFFSGERGMNGMHGTTLYFSISNLKMSDWGLLDVDFENSTVELLYSNKTVTDEVVYTQTGLAKSGEQYFVIPAYTQDDAWFETGMYSIRVTVKSRSGSVDFARSLNLVYDAGIPENDGLRSYSHDLRYESGAYRNRHSSDTPIDSFGIAVQPGIEAHRNNVFAVYTGGVTGFSFTLRADDTTEEYDGITVGEVEGFRYWNSLSAPDAEDLEGYGFSRYDMSDDPCLIVTSGVESIYTEETIPKGAEGLGDIYLVEGVNVICYQVKMANGYISPVKQFTIIVTQYIPEFNVIVSDYTPSFEAAQRDGQVNAHDITVKIEEAFSLNGSGKVDVEVWSSYAMKINGVMVEESDGNDQAMYLTRLTNIGVGDTATITENSYTTCFPPYSGQGNYCTSAFMAIDEYGGMVVYAPQIGPLSRVYDSSNPVSDNYAIEYYGNPQDDPFTIGYDVSFITIYNQPIFFGEQLVGFENLTSKGWGPYEQTETSIAALEYNLFAIDSNDVKFGGFATSAAGDKSSSGVTWNTNVIDNYNLIDWARTSISFYLEDGTPIAEGIDMNNPGVNAAGYLGCGVSQISYGTSTGTVYETHFALSVASPEATEKNPAYDPKTGEGQERIIFAIKGKNIYGDDFEESGSFTRYYISYDEVDETMTSEGIVLDLPFKTVECGQKLVTGIFNGNGQSYEYELTDIFGNKHTVSGTLTQNFDEGTDIIFSTHEATSKPVEITIKRVDGLRIYVDITDAEILEVIGNGTGDVTIIAHESIQFSYKYKDADGNETVKSLKVDNIVKPKPYISVDVDTNNYLVDENGVAYRYGNVTVTLVDDNFDLTDIYTGEIPRYTFVPGGPTSYTFSKEEILASFGDEEAISIPRTMTYTLGFELREIIDPMEVMSSATHAPAIRINAFKEDRGYYKDMGLSLVLEPSGAEGYVADGKGETLRYLGKRVNASALLEKLGWGSSYRFLTEITCTGSTKVFVKQGLYSEAPDYESGVSDVIDGVTLNGRLLTVEKNAKFTLFVVTKNGLYTSVVFDVNEIGNAPKPTTVKVPIDDKTVRVYVIAPDGSEDFRIAPADAQLAVKSESEGDYAGVPYVEYSANDDYVINYTFTFNGEKVSGWIDTSIYEIRARKMAQVGTISWSANKAMEATGNTVNATLSFNELISGVEITRGDVDSGIVNVSHSGKQVMISFNDNHEGFTLKITSAYGSVVVDVDGVDNIDRETPLAWEMNRTLSPDGKTVTVILATSERTVFREGGYIGEQSKDDQGNDIYVYTRIITENGSYTYHFTDMSGLETSIVVAVNEIVTGELTLSFSQTKDIESAVTDPSTLDLKIGDKIYVTPSTDADIRVNDNDAKHVKAGEWLEMVIENDAAGSSPYVIATDSYGRVTVRQFSQITPKDLEAPVITVASPVVTVVAGVDREEVREALLENVSAVDLDTELTYDVKFTDDLSVSGTTAVEYTVTDSNGNSATASCRLKVVSGSEPIIHINGEKVDRDASYYTESGAALTLTVDVDGQPYRAYIKSGIKTVAQMKIDPTSLTGGYVTGTSISIGELESGFYTLIVQTQSRDYFRIIIYVY